MTGHKIRNKILLKPRFLAKSKIFTLEAKKLVAQYSAKLEWQRKILQEIKEIAEKELYLKQNNGIKQILQKITKAEEE